jgi:hypothetical protein
MAEVNGEMWLWGLALLYNISQNSNDLNSRIRGQENPISAMCYDFRIV